VGGVKSDEESDDEEKDKTDDGIPQREPE